MKKVSEFVREIHSHAVYQEPELSREFEKDTGKKACWPTHSVGKTNSTLGKLKGITSEIKGNESDRVSYGYEIANHCEQTYANSSDGMTFYGRGFSYRASLAALEKIGL